MAFYRKFSRGRGVRRGNYNNVKYVKQDYKRGIKQVNNKMGAYAKRPTLQKVIQVVNKAINKNAENKMSNNATGTQPICNYAGVKPQWWLYSFDTFFDMSGGTAQAQRIGNRFKLKTWKIKCLISPATDGINPANWASTYLSGTFQGTLTVFLGKQINGKSIFDNAQLEKLYQNGNTSIDPVGNKLEQLYTINNDIYKIYTKRTYKMGVSDLPDTQTQFTSASGLTTPLVGINPNNDYKLTQTFTIDVLKYIGKNATIKFNDSSSSAQVPSSMEGLHMWAIWSPISSDLSQQASRPNSFYSMTMNTFFEYEDS